MATAPRPTVLCVDDDAAVRLFFAIELEDHFEVVTIANGTDALDLLSRRRIDAILLDLNMPEIPGEEFLQLLRASGSRVPVVVLTVVEQASSIVRCTPTAAPSTDAVGSVRDAEQTSDGEVLVEVRPVDAEPTSSLAAKRSGSPASPRDAWRCAQP